MKEDSNRTSHPDFIGAHIDPSAKGTALITGASSGIGAIYADRLAKRGYDLILVARNRERLEMLARRIDKATKRAVRIVCADLNDKSEIRQVEQVLRADPGITMLVNNAGVGVPTPFLATDIDKLERMIDLNVTALVRLTYAIMPTFVRRGSGSIINIASVVGVAPELLNGVYGGTKAFVLAFSISLHNEFAPRNIRIQAVLPGATATAFWSAADTPLDQLPVEMVMKSDDMVDAALAGFDQSELVTIPSLPDITELNSFEAARQRLMPKLSLSTPAARYRVANIQPHGNHHSLA